MPARLPYIAAYDSPDSRRRARMLDHCRAFGFDAQFSVFECVFSASEQREFWAGISNIADPGADRVMLLQLDRTREPIRLGTGVSNDDADENGFIYIG